jgi:hypothetical protein
MTGEKIYEYDLDVTGVTDYGVTLQGILSGNPKSRRKVLVAEKPFSPCYCWHRN